MGYSPEPHGKAANKQGLFKAEQFLSRYGMKGLRLYFRAADRLEVSLCLCLYLHIQFVHGRIGHFYMDMENEHGKVAGNNHAVMYPGVE